jgi:preprotein translocase SecE subunit
VPTPPVPAELEHASADVDEFDAAIVRGAEGVAEPEPEPADAPAVAIDDESLLEDEPDVEDRLEERAIAGDGAGGGIADGGGNGDGGAPGGRGPGGEAAREHPAGAPLPSGNRVIAFLRASWAELQRVQWPDRRQVTQATAVVLGFVAVAGLYLGAADFVAKEIVEFVL